jgi:DNA-3-methyladenine glycosylase I
VIPSQERATRVTTATVPVLIYHPRHGERGDSDEVTTPRVDDNEITRCAWATGEWLVPYHDDEWGTPVHDDRRHYEFLVLEAAQAGLSWLTVLKRREGYRKAFAGFDPEAVARFSAKRIEAILADPGVIRNRQKIESAVGNARALLDVRDEFSTFDAYLWHFVDGRPVHNGWRSTDEIPATTPLSVAVSKDLKQRGFRFVGPTVCYSHLQAAGLVNDHLVSCFRWGPLSGGA